jgi:nicotinamide mononucleotide transporter
VIIGSMLSLILLVGAAQHRLPTTPLEALGFITGGLCVWLVVKDNIWNWPTGIINNLLLILLFSQAKLYADTTLQFVYIVLGAFGWYWWLHGGENKVELSISHADRNTLVVSAITAIVSTIAVTRLLIYFNGAAPFWDATTTVLSLTAQYLLMRKVIENWYFWIAADIIYIPLYCSKRLYLTAFLYVIFLGMCVLGLIEWRKNLQSQEHAAAV